MRQLYQQQRLRLAGLGHMTLIPQCIEKSHIKKIAKFRSGYNGVKDLPPYRHLKVTDIQRAQDAMFTHKDLRATSENSKTSEGNDSPISDPDSDSTESDVENTLTELTTWRDQNKSSHSGHRKSVVSQNRTPLPKCILCNSNIRYRSRRGEHNRVYLPQIMASSGKGSETPPKHSARKTNILANTGPP